MPKLKLPLASVVAEVSAGTEDAVTVGVEKNSDSGNAKFSGSLSAVAVNVVKFYTDDGTQWYWYCLVAEINCSRSSLTCCQRHSNRVNRSCLASSRYHLPDAVSASRQVAESETAVSPGSCGSFAGTEDAVTVGVEKNSDSGNAKFSGSLSAVAVNVVEFYTGDGTQRYDNGNRLCGKFRSVAGGVGCCGGD